MRIFYYSHDAYGEGHLQHTLAIAKQITLDFPEATQLIVSGTPQPRGVELPERLDFIKLPRLDESIIEDFHAPSLSLPFRAISGFRERIILQTIKHFRPEVVFVQSPKMVSGEILPALDYLECNWPETKVLTGEDNMEVKMAMLLYKSAGSSSVSIPVSSKNDHADDTYLDPKKFSKVR